MKCSECGSRLLLPLAGQVIYNHLAGEHVVGVYPLLADDTCHFLATDFDEAEWRDDAKAFAVSCHELDVPVAIEISGPVLARMPGSSSRPPYLPAMRTASVPPSSALPAPELDN